MGRDDVPQQNLLPEAELQQRAAHDRGARLGRPRAGHLALRREREAAHPRAPVPRGLAHEEDRRLPPQLEVGLQPLPEVRRRRVLVERPADPRPGEGVHETTEVRRRVVVHGYVQGVFFRDTTRRLAERHGVAGWVRNNPDGTVEAAFEGSEDAVERLTAFAREGPRGARVDRVETFDEQPEGLTGFRIA
ncbi:MAG: acylphosphatase [Thermoleophilia bacterium]|nr:acylphosphatase [Thermoleophilia bacterium]